MNDILDTHVIAALVAVQPDPSVTRRIENTEPQAIYLGVITVGEASYPRRKSLGFRFQRIISTFDNGQLLEMEMGGFGNFGMSFSHSRRDYG
jgi:predicted nucleic acid-binding protein